MSDSFGHNILEKVLLPDTVNGQNSRPFSVPRGAKTCTLHVPDLVGAATTLKVQAADPRSGDAESLTFRDLSAPVISGAAFTYSTVSAIAESAATVIPVTALGGGVLRLVASAAQTGAVDALTVLLTWGFDG